MDALPTDLLPATRKTALPHETLLLPDAVGDPPADLPEFDWEEIMQHNTPRDLWRVVGGHVYNVGDCLKIGGEVAESVVSRLISDRG